MVATSKGGVDLVEKGGLGNGRGQVSEHHFGSIHIHLHHKTLENNYYSSYCYCYCYCYYYYSSTITGMEWNIGNLEGKRVLQITSSWRVCDSLIDTSRAECPNLQFEFETPNSWPSPSPSPSPHHHQSKSKPKPKHFSLRFALLSIS
ncbi:hypothetical protein TorRG33x02_202600, partial [Trema orientale]